MVCFGLALGGFCTLRQPAVLEPVANHWLTLPQDI